MSSIVKEIVDEIEESAEEVIEKVDEAVGNIPKKIEEAAEEIEEILEEQEKDEKKIEKKNEKKIFDLYNISEIKIADPGLKNVINLDYKLVVKSRGRIRETHGKAHVNIVERLVNIISVPGHRGKKHKIITKWATGKYNKNLRVVLEAFKIISEKTGKNPVQVLVAAIENSAPRDEITMIQYGGARYPQAVDCAPLRRISLALRNIVHGAYDKSFRSKKSLANALAEEMIVTAEGGNSLATTKKTELEKQADAAR